MTKDEQIIKLQQRIIKLMEEIADIKKQNDFLRSQQLPTSFIQPYPYYPIQTYFTSDSKVSGNVNGNDTLTVNQ